MIVIDLFKYTGKNGTVITPVDLGIPCTEMKRLIADKGKELLKGDERCSCIDVLPDEVELWQEVDELSVEEETSEEVVPDA